MKKTLKIPKQLTRAAAMEDDNGSKRVSISSDVPYRRYDWNADEDYYEVLSHKKDGVSDARMKLGLPILFNHRRDDHLGRAKGYTNDGHRIDVGTLDDLIWSESDFAKTKKKDVESGALVGTSVGYSILDDGVCIGEKDGIPIYEFKWEPHEFSFCTIEADTTVGAGRTCSTKDSTGAEIEMQEILVYEKKDVDEIPNITQKILTTEKAASKPSKKLMAETVTETPATNAEPKVDIVAERAAGRTAYKAACKKIDDYTSGLKNPQWKEAAIKIAAKHKELDEPDFENFRSEACTHFDGVIALTQEQANPNVGIDARSIRMFSVRKAILEMSGTKGLTGLEKEVCEFAAKQYESKDGRTFEGACIPSDITDSRADETLGLDKRGMDNLAWEMRRLNDKLGRTMSASSFTGGGFLVGTDLLGGSYIDYLRNACFIGQGPFGIIELNGLVGNIAIPKQTTTATTYWLPEGGSTTAADFAGSQLYFTPHRLSCLTQFTKQLLLQSTPSVEMLVRNDQAMAVGVEEDRVVYAGSGASGEPLGIINTTGVGANVTFSGNWTWAKTLLFESSLESANVRNIGEMVFVTHPTTKGYAKATPVVASSTFPIFIWMGSKGEFPTIAGVKGGIVNEYGAYATKQVATRVLFGIYNNNVCKARWGGFDLMVEPYTGAATETIKSYLNEWLDVGVRYPQAFEYSTDAPTSP